MSSSVLQTYRFVVLVMCCGLFSKLPLIFGGVA